MHPSSVLQSSISVSGSQVNNRCVVMSPDIIGAQLQAVFGLLLCTLVVTQARQHKRLS